MKEFNGLLDANFDAQAGYWDTEEPEDPCCFRCGSPMHTVNEQRRGCCDECWREVNEEDEL